MSKTKLPNFSETMARDGLYRNAKYKFYIIDPDFSGPLPGSRVLRSHADAYSVVDDVGNITWLETSEIYNPTNLKTAWAGSVPPPGSESMPRLYGHRLRLAEEATFRINDIILVHMEPSVDVAVPMYALNSNYTVGNYARYRASGNAYTGGIFRALVNRPTTGTEGSWTPGTTSLIKKPGGCVFAKEQNSYSYLEPAISMWPLRVVGFEPFGGAIIVETAFDPDKNGGGGSGWIFDCMARTLADIGPEACIFAESQPMSNQILSDNGSDQTLRRMVYHSTDARTMTYKGYKYQFYNPGGIRFYPENYSGVNGRFVVLAQVAENHADDDLGYDQQKILYVWRARTTFTDAMIEEDETYGAHIRGAELVNVGIT
jgi:hypothetical protein